METNYTHLEQKEGICGGRVVIKGTRLEPKHVLSYGRPEEIINHFGLNEAQIKEAQLYVSSQYPVLQKCSQSMYNMVKALHNGYYEGDNHTPQIKMKNGNEILWRGDKSKSSMPSESIAQFNKEKNVYFIQKDIAEKLVGIEKLIGYKES